MDRALKQRLVGASVIIALAVIILPMLLTGPVEPEGQESRSIEIPPRPAELSSETRRFPVGEQDDQRPQADEQDLDIRPVALNGPVNDEVLLIDNPPVETDAQEDQEQQDEQQNTAPVIDALPPAAVITTENSVPADPDESSTPVSSTPPPAGRYLVQVASFSSLENAARLGDQLRDLSLPVLMDTVESDVGVLQRVRVGPYDSQNQASRIMETIAAQVSDISPRVIDLLPDESAPVTEPSDPLIRWVVQVGSFSGEINAGNLVQRLRSAGFKAYSETVSNANETVYKVRVGPELERSNAVALAAEIKQQLDINGLVMSTD